MTRYLRGPHQPTGRPGNLADVPCRPASPPYDRQSLFGAPDANKGTSQRSQGPLGLWVTQLPWSPRAAERMTFKIKKSARH